MRSIYLKKLGREMGRNVEGPFDASIVQFQLQRLQNIIYQLSHGNMQRVDFLQRQVKNDTNLLFTSNKKKVAMDVLLKNVQALTSIKKQDHLHAFKIVKQIQKTSTHELLSIDLVRIKLTKLFIFYLTEEQKLVLCSKQRGRELVEECCRELNRIWNNEKGVKINQKYLEANLLIVHYVIAEMRKNHFLEECAMLSQQIWRIAMRGLGESHKLSRMFRLEFQREMSVTKMKKRTISQFDKNSKNYQTLDKNRSKVRNQTISKTMLSSNAKEKEIKRIYNCEKKMLKTEGSQHFSRKEHQNYVNSLFKVKQLYKRKRCTTENVSVDPSMLQGRKGDEDCGNVQVRKAREVILKGRTLNRELLMNSRLGKSKKRINGSRAATSGFDSVEAENLQVKDTFSEVDKKVIELKPVAVEKEEKMEVPIVEAEPKGKEQCQLI